MTLEAPDWLKHVERAEAQHVTELHADMTRKKEHWLKTLQVGNDVDQRRSRLSFKSAEQAYWREIERLNYGEDHELGDAWQWAQSLAISQLDTQEVDSPWPAKYWDDDRDDNDWMRD